MSTSALLIRFFLYSLVLIILAEIAQFLLRFPLLQRILGAFLFLHVPQCVELLQNQ